MYRIRTLIVLVPLLILARNANAQNANMSTETVPVSTQWVLDAVGSAGRSAVASVYMVTCPRTGLKGTGFLIRSGQIITCDHVIEGNQPADIQATSSFGRNVHFAKVIADPNKDLAILIPTEKLKGGLELGSDDSLAVGTAVDTWGFPYSYNGPSPLLSVGYLSGFAAYYGDSTRTTIVKHLVVNGAFNPGNSGGPLFASNKDIVIGIVVSKLAPITPFQLSAIKVLAENHSGVTFTATDGQGHQKVLVESQIVADMLQYFHDLTQVMIGEAISVSELRAFLAANGIKQ